MPNRILRDWTDSEAVGQLSPQAETFFVRLIMKADDYGRYLANRTLLRAAMYPLKLEAVREADIDRWIAECVKACLVRLYSVEGKEYIEISKFGQRLQSVKSKYPPPNQQLQKPTVNNGDKPPTRVRTKSESESETQSEVKSEAETDEAQPHPVDRTISKAMQSEGFPEAWADWLEYRTKRPEPYIGPTQKSNLLECERWGPGKSVELIRMAINKGWKSIQEPSPFNGSGQSRDPNGPPPPKKQPRPGESNAARIAQAMIDEGAKCDPEWIKRKLESLRHIDPTYPIALIRNRLPAELQTLWDDIIK